MLDHRNVRRQKIFLIDENFKIPFDSSNSLSEIYHENSKLRKTDTRPWLSHVVPPKLKSMPLKNFFSRAKNSYKIYNGAPNVSFAKPSVPVPGSLWDIIARRRSRREYADTPMELADLADILFYSYGETGQVGEKEASQKLRAAPSAGALYPLDIYILAENVNGLEQGLYHYNVKSHCAELLKSGSHIDGLHIFVQPTNNEWILSAPCILFITATFGRNQIKYGERGYRGVLFDSGHLSQNILLSAECLNYSSCLTMACLDDEINDFLHVDGLEESVLFAITIGKNI